MKNPFIAAVLALAAQSASVLPDPALMNPVPRKRKGKARANVKSIMSNRQERQLYRSMYMPHQGLKEKARRQGPVVWNDLRGTGLNSRPQLFF